MSTTDASTDRSDAPASPPWHALPPDEAARRLDVDPGAGLSHDEVRARRDEHGPNRLAEPERRSALRRLLDQFLDPLIGVLMVAAVLAGAVGDLKDTVVIAAVLTLNAILGFVQEGRAENALAALEGMLSQEVTVRRDGRAVDVGVEELVPGDVVLLEAGDRVPADGRILRASAAAADESMLTGESVPADKSAAALEGAEDHPDLGDRRNELFMNTTFVRGSAELLVTGTGMSTEVGQIAELLNRGVETETPLERQLEALGRRLIGIVAVAIGVVLALALARGRELSEALLEAVALGVAAIPEGLPAVVTVTLAVGVSQMARRNAIVRRLASVETLGSTTVICTDKTGTLTRNEMTPVEVWHGDADHHVEGGAFDHEPSPTLVEALTIATHASDATLEDPEEEDDDHVGDPTELAVLMAARAAGVDTDGVRADAPRLGVLPFDSATKLMATVPDLDGRGLIAVKGAPDVLLERCTSIATEHGLVELDDALRNDIDTALRRHADEGRRVLAIASREVAEPPTGPEAISEQLEELTLQALVAMVDPPRDGVAEAVELCRKAGVDVKMITGDHPGTAAAIARQIGIEGEVVTGRDLDAMDDEELAIRIPDIGVCARVSPEHKVRIVDALQADGEVVAMTGDGVNDAAALRGADVGVAMGISGTEVTKEAADMVLADDDFSTIVTAIERGRTIYGNIVRFVRFQLTTNFAAIVTILIAGIIGLPAPFTAIQILFVNLIADGPPAMALGVDRARHEVMERPPRATDRAILDRSVVGYLARTGFVMAAITLAVHALNDGTETQVTLTFTTFVLLQVTNVFAVRGQDLGVFGRHQFSNRWVWAAVGLVLALQVAVVHVGVLQDLVETVPLSLEQWGLAIGLSVAPLLLTAITRRLGLGVDDR